MIDLPPPLAWIPGFVQSLSGALGTSVDVALAKTVNPLVYKVQFTFGEVISGKRMLLVWNLYQKYAAKNDAFPQGKIESEGRSMSTHIAITRRFGLPRNEHPLG